jgi:hypothetical protein
VQLVYVVVVAAACYYCCYLVEGVEGEAQSSQAALVTLAVVRQLVEE